RTPLEIWTKILGHACIDSSTTDHQLLSLISRFIREASALVKLQSISVHGRRQIIAFHQLLSQTPPHLRRIRYLFLSTAPLPPTSRGPAHFVPRDPPMDSEEAKQFRSACRGVLAAVAECVEILYLDLRATRLKYMPTTPFPQLVELASNGFPIVPDYSHTISGPSNAPRGPCPQLRRWHLMQLPRVLRGQGGVATICTTAPAITHLRFSGLQRESHFASDLKVGLPETIHYVYVKPERPLGRGRKGGTARISYIRLMDGL
ncbi:hypothetical protein FIBSPDRAFT_860780, partial [Athelia psychrophila]